MSWNGHHLHMHMFLPEYISSPDCNTPVTDTVCSVSYGSIAVRWRFVS